MVSLKVPRKGHPHLLILLHQHLISSIRDGASGDHHLSKVRKLGVLCWILEYYFMFFYVILEPGHHGNGHLNRKSNWKGMYPVSGVELLSSCHPESLDVDGGVVLPSLLVCTTVQSVLVFLWCEKTGKAKICPRAHSYFIASHLRNRQDFNFLGQSAQNHFYFKVGSGCWWMHVIKMKANRWLYFPPCPFT